MDPNATVGLRVFTVGHSNYPVGHLLELLRSHSIQVVVDVRSAPYSRHAPQFNRPELTRYLSTHGLTYEFLGGSLGGRPDDPECYDASGHVLYQVLEATPEYVQGMRELIRLAAGSRPLCLMCSEEDPAICHRALSIGHVLTQEGVEVNHIRRDGSMELQEELQGRSINVPVQFNLFNESPARKSPTPIRRDKDRKDNTVD